MTDFKIRQNVKTIDPIIAAKQLNCPIEARHPGTCFGATSRIGEYGTDCPFRPALAHLRMTEVSGLHEDFLGSLRAKAKACLKELKGRKLSEIITTDFAGQTLALLKNGWRSYAIRNCNSHVLGTDKKKLAAVAKMEEHLTASELQPVVQALERSLKEHAREYLASLEQMEKLIDAQDYATLEMKVVEMRRSSSDFDAARIVALIEAVKMKARFYLSRAELASEHGDLKGAMFAFQRAAAIWPSNPALIACDRRCPVSGTCCH